MDGLQQVIGLKSREPLPLDGVFVPPYEPFKKKTERASAGLGQQSVVRPKELLRSRDKTADSAPVKVNASVSLGKQLASASLSAQVRPRMKFTTWLKSKVLDYMPAGLREATASAKILNRRTDAENKDPNHYLTKAENNAWKAASSPLTKRNARVVATAALQNLIGEGIVRLPQFGALVLQGYTYVDPVSLVARAKNKVKKGKFSHPVDDIKKKIVDPPTEAVAQSVWKVLSGGMPYQAYKDPQAYYNSKIIPGSSGEKRWEIENERDAMRLGYWSAVEIRLLSSDPILKGITKAIKLKTVTTPTSVQYVSKFNRTKTYYKYGENIFIAMTPSAKFAFSGQGKNQPQILLRATDVQKER